MYNRHYSRFKKQPATKINQDQHLTILQPSCFPLSFWKISSYFVHLPALFTHHNSSPMVVLYPLSSIGGQTMFMYIETSVCPLGLSVSPSMFQSVSWSAVSPLKNAPQMGVWKNFFVDSHKLGYIQFI